MKCPKCREAIASDAKSHACGWKIGALEAQAAPVSPVATLAQVEAHLEKIRQTLGMTKKEFAGLIEPPVRKIRNRVPMLPDVGHGTVCTCELCWAARRTPPKWPGEPQKGQGEENASRAPATDQGIEKNSEGVAQGNG